MFDKYKCIEKSQRELEIEKIVSTVNNTIWHNNGLMTIYRFGAILQLETIAKALSKYNHLTKTDILGIIKTYEEYDDVSGLVAAILKEYEDKEN